MDIDLNLMNTFQVIHIILSLRNLSNAAVSYTKYLKKLSSLLLWKVFGKDVPEPANDSVGVVEAAIVLGVSP